MDMSQKAAAHTPEQLARIREAASKQNALLIEALDLVPRISDDEPMAPALAEWCRNARLLLARARGEEARR
jgi:hypothetical protein